MFSTICPNVYRSLRERTKMSQGRYGKAVGASRNTIHNFETGKSRPDAAQEARMLEVSKCSKLEFVEIACAELGSLIGMPVGIHRDQGLKPIFTINEADIVLRQRSRGGPSDLARALNRKLTITQMMGLVFDFHNNDLEELIHSCQKENAQEVE